MDEFLCSCCCEPLYLETDYWSSDVQPAELVYVEPAYVDLAYVEPVYVEPVYVEPVYVEPVYVEPAYVEPAYVEPAYVEPYVAPAVAAPAAVEPVTLTPQYSTIGGWEPAFTVALPDAVTAPAAVLANVPTVVSGYDPGISLAEALASPTFGGNPWDTTVSQVYIQNTSAYPTTVTAPAWNAYTDPLINGALVANELALLNIRNASRPLG